jgi:DNA-directed RNA polymerase specialized sigma24 family protein
MGASRSAPSPTCRGPRPRADRFPLPVNDHRAAVESVFRLEAGRILAALIRVSGSFDLAEEALQEALAAAVAHWQTEGIPRNPGAWITAAAQRKMIDLVRRARTRKGALQDDHGAEGQPRADAVAAEGRGRGSHGCGDEGAGRERRTLKVREGHVRSDWLA